MKTNMLHRLNLSARFALCARRFAFLSLCAVLSIDVQGASLTWDTTIAADGTITAGSGTWQNGAGNWNNGSTSSGINWNNATPDVATFAGADGTYAITVGGAITCGTPLTFNNDGYTLSAASTEVITFASVVTIAAGKTATIGNNVQLTRPGAWTLNGPGTLNVSGPGSVFGNASGAGSTIGTGATINVTNGGSLLCGATLSMSTSGGNTSLKVDGGSVSVPAGSVNLIVNASSAGGSTVTLTNGGTILIPSITGGGLRFGSAASTGYGVFNLDGGTLTTGRIFKNSGATIHATNNFNGGILRAVSGIANGSILLTGLDCANVRNGGAIVDPNGASVIISQPLLHSSISGDSATDGGLKVIGTGGTVTITGTNTYTGPTTINGSTLGILAPYNAITATTVNNGGRLKVTASTNSSVLPALTINNGGGILFDLGSYNSANVQGITNGNLIVSGTNIIDIAGSSIPVTTITLLTYTNKTGNSTFILGTLPSGLTGTLTDNGSNLVLNVTSPSGNSYTWSAGSGDWDFASSNWNSGGSIYSELQPAIVTFPDSAVGTVNITTNVKPYSITVTANTGGYTFTGVGSIGGATSFSKLGVKLLTLATSNSYTGATTISAGAIVATANNALGNPAGGGVMVNDGAALALSGNLNYLAAEPLTISGPGLGAGGFFSGSASQRGALQSISGNNTWAGDITFTPIDNNTRIGVQDGAQLTLTGKITQGTNGLNLIFRMGSTAGSDITVSGTNNNWTGSTSIFGGDGAAFHIGANNALPTASLLTVSIAGIGGDCVFDLNGFNQEVAGLSGDVTGIITDNGGQPSTLILNLSSTNQNYPGTIQDGANSVSIVKKGAWTETFSNACTYSGTTTINAGALSVLGSLGTTPLTVNTSGTLDGTGTIGGPVTINPGGTLTAGNGGIGTLTIDNNLMIEGNLMFKLNESLAQSNDFVNVSGILANSGTGTLFVTNTGTNVPAAGDSFTLFNQPVSGGHLLSIVGPVGMAFTNRLEIDGSIAVVTPSIANYPTNITFTVNGAILTLNWPGTHLGWYIQSNSLGLLNTNYWFDIPNSQNGTNLNITIDPAQHNVFYRLRHP